MKILKIFFLIILFGLNSCANSEIKDKEFKKRIKQIGKELIKLKTKGDFRTNKNFLVNNIVNVGENLFNLIQSSKPFDNVTFNVKKGDVIPIGRETADFTLEIIKKDLNLKVRLKYDSDYDKFHILGFTTKW